MWILGVLVNDNLIAKSYHFQEFLTMVDNVTGNVELSFVSCNSSTRSTRRS